MSMLICCCKIAAHLPGLLVTKIGINLLEVFYVTFQSQYICIPTCQISSLNIFFYMNGVTVKYCVACRGSKLIIFVKTKLVHCFLEDKKGSKDLQHQCYNFPEIQ